MPDELTTSDAKLIQYLNEAYGKEKELETALQAHIKMTRRPPYKKRLQDAPQGDQGAGEGLEKRIKAAGREGRAPDRCRFPARGGGRGGERRDGGGDEGRRRGEGPAACAARHRRGREAAQERQGPSCGTSSRRSATTSRSRRSPRRSSDKETAKLARAYRREEERMAKYLQKLIPTLTKAVVTEEIPAAERRAPRAAGSRGTARTRAASAPRSSGSASRSSRSSSRGSRSRSTRAKAA